MRIPPAVYVVALMTSTAFGCEDTSRPPGAPPCESASVDAGPEDGAPTQTLPCPMPSTGGTPGGYSLSPGNVPSRSWNTGGDATDGGLGTTGSGGATGIGGSRG